jgi:hypothetical protein
MRVYTLRHIRNIRDPGQHLAQENGTQKLDSHRRHLLGYREYVHRFRPKQRPTACYATSSRSV